MKIMSVITMIQEVKEIHPDNIAIIKIGKFYHVYGKDAYIVSDLFKYNLREADKNIKTCGFPATSLSKVEATLENKKINYMLLDRRNNYDVDKVFDMKNLNKYNDFYDVAKKNVNIRNRIENISNYLYNNVRNADINIILNNIEKVIYE